MSLIVEDSPWIFLIMTVILGGGAAFLAGQALARGWRPWWKPLVFTIPLGAAVRFLHFALFDGDLSSVHYFVTDTAVLLAAAFLGYRLALTSQMVRQYPWLYERAGPLSWRSKG